MTRTIRCTLNNPDGSPLPAPGDGRLTKRTAFALVAMGLAVITIANDFTAFSVAIPTMENQLHASLSTVQWVLNAYALVFGVAIVTGGRLADMFGRRLGHRHRVRRSWPSLRHGSSCRRRLTRIVSGPDPSPSGRKGGAPARRP